jgi:hypothetical protein
MILSEMSMIVSRRFAVEAKRGLGRCGMANLGVHSCLTLNGRLPV